MSKLNPKPARPEKISLRDSDTFQQVYEQNHLIVFRFIYGLHGGPTETVEDLTAETFMRAWKARRRFRGNHKAALGWLLKIARNLVIDAHRRKKTRGLTQDVTQYVLPSDDPTPEQQTQLQEQIRILWSLLHTLPAQQREILVLRYLLDWRVKDIGNHLDMKENTVSVYIRRALKRLRQDWPRQDHND